MDNCLIVVPFHEDYVLNNITDNAKYAHVTENSCAA